MLVRCLVCLSIRYNFDFLYVIFKHDCNLSRVNNFIKKMFFFCILEILIDKIKISFSIKKT